MPRKSVVGRKIEYGTVYYSVLDIRYNKVFQNKSIFYPANMKRRKVERKIKEALNNTENGQFYHFLGIDKMETEVKDFRLPVKEYITYCLNHDYFIEEKEKDYEQF